VTSSARVGWGTRTGASVRLIAAGVVLVSVYESLGSIIDGIGPPPRDRWILAVERTLFRESIPPLAPVHLPPWIVDAFSVAYVVYFALPVILLAALVRRGQLCDARAAMRTLLIAYYMHYAIYIVVPVVGPVRALEVPAVVKLHLTSQGGVVTRRLRAGISALERTRQDAFPSAHASIAMLVAAFARRHRLRFHALFSVAAGAIVGSTVVLGFHYGVDVVAAVPLAWAAWRAGLDRGLAPHLKSRAWRSSITSTSA